MLRVSRKSVGCSAYGGSTRSCIRFRRPARAGRRTAFLPPLSFCGLRAGGLGDPQQLASYLSPAAWRLNTHNFEPRDIGWGREVVGELISAGVVKEWGRARGKPHGIGVEAADEPLFIRPIGVLEKSSSTPSDRNLRLIHDYRAINEHLDTGSETSSTLSLGCMPARARPAQT